MARKNKFSPRPNRQLSKTQEQIAAHWQGDAPATAKFLGLNPRTVFKALRSPRLRKLVYGEVAAAADTRASNVERLKRIAENRGGKFSEQQVLNASLELEKTYARLERQQRRDAAKAARANAPKGADPSKPCTDSEAAARADAYAQGVPYVDTRELAKRVKLLMDAPLSDKTAKLKQDAPWLFDDDPPAKAAAPEPTAPKYDFKPSPPSERQWQCTAPCGWGCPETGLAWREWVAGDTFILPIYAPDGGGIGYTLVPTPPLDNFMEIPLPPVDLSFLDEEPTGKDFLE
jgi:hypothetical protein